MKPPEGEKHFMAYNYSELSLACTPDPNKRMTTAMRTTAANVMFVANKETYQMYFFAQV